MVLDIIIKLSYLIGAISIVWGLKYLSSPTTARKGNILAGAGMGLAILASLIQPMDRGDNNYTWILTGLVLGGMVGYAMAMRVKMTQMPQLVSMFNGFGGASAMILSGIELSHTREPLNIGNGLILIGTLLIGAISFTGSLLAYLKLDGRINDKRITFKGHTILNNVFIVILIILSIVLLGQPVEEYMYMGIGLSIVAMIYGFSFVAPIGGADMPVVISLLNSLTGVSAATAGVLFGSQIMTIGGILVGASGIILTVMMCDAMNRSLWNVLFGSFGAKNKGIGFDSEGGEYKEVSHNDLAVQLYYASRVMIVPGYGLAVSQAQKTCQELATQLEKNNVEVLYAIHPVAGRMPGHMNVLLAEANVSYDRLLALDEANEKFVGANVVLIIGANDVVNPAAKDNPTSPIYGMPILEVLASDQVVVLKRSMNTGYAGIDNPLFFHPKTKMLFGDAKDSLQILIQEIKSLS